MSLPTLLAVGIATACASDRGDRSADVVFLEYIAHAAFALEDDAGQRILIDPYANFFAYTLPSADELDVDAVYVSHPHFDHDGGMSINERFPFALEARTAPGATEVGNFRVTGVVGRHARDFGADFGNMNTIWRIDVAGLRIVHWGDNDANVDALVDDLRDVDVLMLPVDASEHLLDFEEVDAIRAALTPRIIVPMHYRMPELEQENTGWLGDIDPWLDGHDGAPTSALPTALACADVSVAASCAYPTLPAQSNVKRLATNRIALSRDLLPADHEVWVFPPSARVQPQAR